MQPAGKRPAKGASALVVVHAARFVLVILWCPHDKRIVSLKLCKPGLAWTLSSPTSGACDQRDLALGCLSALARRHRLRLAYGCIYIDCLPARIINGGSSGELFPVRVLTSRSMAFLSAFRSDSHEDIFVPGRPGRPCSGLHAREAHLGSQGLLHGSSCGQPHHVGAAHCGELAHGQHRRQAR